MSERALTDIATINPPLTRTPKPRELISFVSMSGVSEGGGITESSDLPFNTVGSGFTRFQNGDVLFAKITPCMENGKGALAESLTGGIGCGSTEFHVLRATQASVPGYLYQLMQWKQTRQTAEIFMSGSAGQQRVQSDFFSRYKVYAPALPVQQKIATILTSIDTAIEKTEALIAKYQQIKAGLMHDLFTRGVLPNGQLRPPREQAPELYQETAIGWIPREWNPKTLRTACDWYSGGTPSKRNEEWWKGTLPWLSPKDMKRFELADTEDHVTRQAAIFGSRIAPKGSVFIVVRGMILAHSFPVIVNSVEFAFNQDVKAVIGRAPLMNRYLAYWFVANTDLFLKKTTESTHGTKRFDLNDLYKIDIGVPTESEQLRVIARLDVVESRIQTEIQRCDKLRRQKAGLMHDLLTGKVKIPNFDQGDSDA